MKNNYLSYILWILLSASSLSAQPIDLVWANRTGGDATDFPRSMVQDAAGNLYLVGSFRNTVDFNPRAGVFNLSSNGDSDIFIQKIDSAGQLIWAKSMGSTGNDVAYKVSLDPMGNLGVIGEFRGTVDFDPNGGVTNLTSNGDADVFVTKLDSAGNLLWARSMGGSNRDQGRGIGFDMMGNVYTTGTFQATVDFDPNAGTTNLTSNGIADIFMQKLDPNGAFLWVRSFGGTSSEGVSSLEVDALGNVYTMGFYRNTVDFDPGAGVVNETSTGTGTDTYLLKLDAAGDFVWMKSIKGAANNFANTLTFDAQDNIYLGGHFFGTSDFDPGAGVFNLTSNGFADAYVQKLDVNGNFIWARTMGGSSFEFVSDLAVGNTGELYVAGEFGDTVDFDFSPAVDQQVATGTLGGVDMFLQQMDTAGNHQWVFAAGNVSDDGSMGITVNDQGELFYVAYFTDSIDVDPSGDTALLVSDNNSLDMALMKFRPDIITTILPISLNKFEAERISSNEVALMWQLPTTELPAYFEMERTNAYDLDFEAITIIPATNTTKYQYWDTNASEAISYYRLKMVAMDGEVSYSAIKAVEGTLNEASLAEIYPNPVRENINIRFKKATEEVQVQLLDITGKQQYQATVRFPNSYFLQLSPLNLPAGVYILHLSTSNGEQLTQQIIKQ